MRNTQENFPNVAIENLSDWEIVRIGTNEIFDVLPGSQVFNGDEGWTEVKFLENEQEVTVRFGNSEKDGNLENSEYAVRLKYGGETVNHDGIVTDKGVEIPLQEQN